MICELGTKEMFECIICKQQVSTIYTWSDGTKSCWNCHEPKYCECKYPMFFECPFCNLKHCNECKGKARI